MVRENAHVGRRCSADQAMLNMVVWTSNLSTSFSIVQQGSGPVNTLAWVPDDVLRANVLVRNSTAALPTQWSPPLGGGIALLRSQIPSGALRAVAIVLNTDGTPSPVVHQHDRKPWLWDPLMEWADGVAREVCNRFAGPPHDGLGGLWPRRLVKKNASSAITMDECLRGQPSTGR
eukprot:1190685-Prymnesium_polylepis.2